MSGGAGCNRGAPRFAVADHNFKQESVNVYPAREGRRTRTFGVMIRARRKELGLRQEDLSPRIEIEGRPISQTHLSDLERGVIAPRPYLIEQFARALEMNRDVL